MMKDKKEFKLVEFDGFRMESYNAQLISKGIKQAKRLVMLNQMASLIKNKSVDKLRENNQLTNGE